MAKMALSSEGFRQDVREANENRLKSGCALGHFVERGVSSHVVKLNIFVGRAPTTCPNTGKQASYAGIDT
jgi:hypothetical protein